ncbi:MAG: hypothetical protein M0R37_13455 [Bacteroidales bacterium]|nr:hypothetical protein [Bacteroidales bacterium]
MSACRQLSREDYEEVRRRVDQARRELISKPSLRDEIVRQYVENGLDSRMISDLLGMSYWQVRAVLRARGIRFPKPPLAVRRSNARQYCLTVPAAIHKQLDGSERYECELVAEGILYRRVA